ncbi:MAG: CheR family methyltransferase, partial [Pseudomonadota bacterium]
RWFMTSRSGDGRLRVVPELRQLATWRRASLTDSGSLDGIEADLVFLRNVLIYFSADTRRLVLRNILDRLRPGGILFTGHTETGAARDDRLVAIAPSIYRKKA